MIESRYAKKYKDQADPFTQKKKLYNTLAKIFAVLLGIVCLVIVFVTHENYMFIPLGLIAIPFAVFVTKFMNCRSKEYDFLNVYNEINYLIEDCKMSAADVSELDTILEDMDKGIYTAKYTDTMVTLTPTMAVSQIVWENNRLIEAIPVAAMEKIELVTYHMLNSTEVDCYDFWFTQERENGATCSVSIDDDKKEQHRQEFLDIVKKTYPDFSIIERDGDEK